MSTDLTPHLARFQAQQLRRGGLKPGEAGGKASREGVKVLRAPIHVLARGLASCRALQSLAVHVFINITY